MRRFLLLSAAALALTACGPKAEKTDKAAGDAAAPAAAAPVALTAAGLPKVRPGLWEVTSSDDGQAVEVEKQCVGEEGTRELRQLLAQGDTPGCKTTRGPKLGGFVVSSLCEQSGVKTNISVEWTGTETAFGMKMKAVVITPDGKSDGGEIVAKGRWIGACPAGVKPGEEVK